MNEEFKSEELKVEKNVGYKCGEWIVAAITVCGIVIMLAGTVKVVTWMLF